MSDGRTYYCSDPTLVVVAHTPVGESEEIAFAAGKVTTDNPAWIPVLEAFCDLGLVSRTPPPKKSKE